jgi:hypothetical protein
MKTMEWLGRWVAYLIILTVVLVLMAVAKWAVVFLVGVP